MIEIDILVRFQPDLIPRVVEQACAAEGLTLALKGTLAKYPGCVHWHFKKGRQPGILEVTWWEQKNRLWFKVAAGRTGTWIEAAIARLKERLEQAGN